MADLNLYTVHSSSRLQREPLLEMLLSELDGMVYCCRQDEHWTMDFVSEGCLKLTGYPARDLLLNSRISYEEITHIDDRKRVRNAIDHALKKGISINVEYRIYHADGSVRWVWERGQGVSMDGYPGALHGFIQDITQRHANEEAMVEAEHRYRSIFENAIEGIFQTTTDGYYLNVNPALATIYGYETTAELQQALKDISQQLYVDPGRRAEFVQLMQSNGGVKSFESQVYRKDGSVIWISENARTVYGPDQRLLYFEGSVEDITERKYYEQRISHQATHDSLTDLPNRLLLLDRLQQLTKNGRRGNSELAVVLLDLDLFKNVNDSLGHAAGDRLIEAIADRLRKCIRDGDTVARIGGDEFVLLLAYPPDNTDHKASTNPLSHLVKRILDIVQAPCRVANRDIEVSCSVGISAATPMIGRDMTLESEHQSPGRALMQFADYFALLQGREVTILRPRQTALSGVYDPAVRQLQLTGEATDSDTREALAHALLPSWLYRQQRYDMPQQPLVLKTTGAGKENGERLTSGS